MAAKKKAKKKTAKKTVKKVKKKTPTKKTKVEVTIRKKVLGHAPEEYHFYLADGKRLRSLYELADSLEEMGDEMFNMYVTPERNDFANWINDIFEDTDLAEEMRKVETRMEGQLQILKKLVKELTSEVNK